MPNGLVNLTIQIEADSPAPYLIRKLRKKPHWWISFCNFVMAVIVYSY